MLEVSVLGYAASGTFLSMSYFDLFYHVVAITVILKTLVNAPAPAPEAEVIAPAPSSQALVKA
jgi:hypothetical protein